MLRKEFRIVLPITVDEYHAAQLWSVAEASKNETGGGEGIEVLNNEPYEKNQEKGQYTKKIYHLQSRVPGFIQVLAPKGSLEFVEEAWNAYPYIKTVITNSYLKENFEICIQSKHLTDLGESENVHKLPENEWKKTEVIKVDIANDPVSSGDYKEEFDPAKFVSKKAKRGPLGPHWIEKLKTEAKIYAETKQQAKEQGLEHNEKPPVYMCAYKLVSCRFKWWGLQNRVEKMIQNQEHRLFSNFHRQVFCWMDNWYGLTMNDIRELEDKTQTELDEMRRKGSIKGMKCQE